MERALLENVSVTKDGLVRHVEKECAMKDVTNTAPAPTENASVILDGMETFAVSVSDS